MIYQIIDNNSFGAPVKLVTRNIAIHPSFGATSDGVLFLTTVGKTGFMMDQRGRLYYNGDGEVRYDYQGRVGSIGQDTVRYDWKGRIDAIGSYFVYYDSYSGKVERISDYVIQYDSYTKLPAIVGGIYFYYNYEYGTSRYEASKIGQCNFYYQSGGKLDKITYYGELPGSPKDPWVNDYCRDNTISIYYDYSGRITKIGSVNIY